MLLIAPALLVLGLALAFWPRSLSIEVTAGEIQVRGSVYGRRIQRSSLDLEHARVIDLESAPELRPRWRTNGVGLPNYRVGWFRLRNGAKALCFLTRTDSVVYLPTKENYVLLLSTPEGAELLSALR